MNTPRFADLGRQPRASDRAKASADANPEDTEPKTNPKPGDVPDEEKDDDMTDTVDTTSKDYLAGQSAAETATRKAERERTSTVLASEHFPGREAMASKLLASEMSATAIIDVLAASPAPVKGADVGAKGEDDESAQGREMLESMKQQGNKDLGKSSNADDGNTGRKKASAVWDRARAANAKA